MDKIRELSIQHSNKLNYLIIIGAIIAATNTICRPDYNFILYLYIFYVWKFMNNQRESQSQEKISIFYFLIYSFIIDIIWCIYWGNKWNSLKKDYENKIHFFVLFFSWIGIIIKIIIIVMIAFIDWESIKSSFPKNIQEKLNKGKYQSFEDENNYT